MASGRLLQRIALARPAPVQVVRSTLRNGLHTRSQPSTSKWTTKLSSKLPSTNVAATYAVSIAILSISAFTAYSYKQHTRKLTQQPTVITKNRPEPSSKVSTTTSSSSSDDASPVFIAGGALKLYMITPIGTEHDVFMLFSDVEKVLSGYRIKEERFSEVPFDAELAPRIHRRKFTTSLEVYLPTDDENLLENLRSLKPVHVVRDMSKPELVFRLSAASSPESKKQNAKQHISIGSRSSPPSSDTVSAMMIGAGPNYPRTTRDGLLELYYIDGRVAQAGECTLFKQVEQLFSAYRIEIARESQGDFEAKAAPRIQAYYRGRLEVYVPVHDKQLPEKLKSLPAVSDMNPESNFDCIQAAAT